MQEQAEILRRQFKEAPPTTDDSEDLLPTLKVTWRAQANDRTNGGYSQESLTDLFSRVPGVCVYVLVYYFILLSSMALCITCWCLVRDVEKL